MLSVYLARGLCKPAPRLATASSDTEKHVTAVLCAAIRGSLVERQTIDHYGDVICIATF